MTLNQKTLIVKIKKRPPPTTEQGNLLRTCAGAAQVFKTTVSNITHGRETSR